MDLLVELSDRTLAARAAWPCALWRDASLFARVQAYSDTPQRVCNVTTRAACGALHHGVDLLEAQFKRECMLRDYLARPPSGARWVLSVDEDTALDAPLLRELMWRLPAPNAPLYVRQTAFANLEVIMAFFLSTRACLGALYGAHYVRCKTRLIECRARRGRECRYAGAYDRHMYNNDHLASFCLQRAAVCAPVAAHGRADDELVMEYNLRRRALNRSAAYVRRLVAFHHAPPTLRWSTQPVARQAQGGLRVRMLA